MGTSLSVWRWSLVHFVFSLPLVFVLVLLHGCFGDELFEDEVVAFFFGGTLGLIFRGRRKESEVVCVSCLVSRGGWDEENNLRENRGKENERAGEDDGRQKEGKTLVGGRKETSGSDIP